MLTHLQMKTSTLFSMTMTPENNAWAVSQETLQNIWKNLGGTCTLSSEEEDWLDLLVDCSRNMLCRAFSSLHCPSSLFMLYEVELLQHWFQYQKCNWWKLKCWIGNGQVRKCTDPISNCHIVYHLIYATWHFHPDRYCMFKLVMNASC